MQSVQKFSRAATKSVVEALASPVLAERYRARLELTGRDQAEAAGAAVAWRKGLRADSAEDARSLVEALWTTQRARRTDFELLQLLLESPVEDARAAAVRVLRDLAGCCESETGGCEGGSGGCGPGAGHSSGAG